ncbi:hypothetical protein NBRC116583_24620 [Arenicella sp. 4NH20-0111]|uniref:sensor histidine kinase n=1 Tax=Arenicella sp. 4NH20-0111 TaxID=3127648 RepID=UPI0031083BAE
MKKYAITLLVLTLIGIALSILLLTQDEKLDQTVFRQTTESIQNLQSLDKNLLVLLNQSRFNSEFDHEVLLDTSYQLSEEFSNLRFEALFEEIEGSPALSAAVEKFDDSYASREEELESYSESNGAMSAAIAKIRSYTERIQSQDLGDSKNVVNGLLGETNAQIFNLTLGGSLKDRNTIVSQLNDLQVEAPTESLDLFSEYKNAVIDILDNHSQSQSSYQMLISLNTGPLLDSIEREYVNYHNQAIKGSTFFRNALIVYGICLLISLIAFAGQIRRNFLFLEQEVADRTEEIKSAYEELQESQEQLIQSEKMASLGQMVAGVAHEINTPLGYVSSNVETLKYNIEDLSGMVSELNALYKQVSKTDRNNKDITQQLMVVLKKYKDVEANDLVEESTQLLDDGTYGLVEISKLVSSLKDFARLDRQATEHVNLHDCIESSLTIASNHIRENNIQVIREFQDLPNVCCTPSKLNQLFLNVITNACQAMGPSGGNLTVLTRQKDDKVLLSFQDEGIGMDEETKSKMFDPFFTSKEIGVGTGLGMSIAFKIIEAHNGMIDVVSEPGKGTTITIILPAG